MNGDCFLQCLLTGGQSEFAQANLTFLYPKKIHARKSFDKVEMHIILFVGYCCPLEAISQLSKYQIET